jgi:hypothetical protein
VISTDTELLNDIRSKYNKTLDPRY